MGKADSMCGAVLSAGQALGCLTSNQAPRIVDSDGVCSLNIQPCSRAGLAGTRAGRTAERPSHID